jgi:pseudo-response regulator 5
MARSHTDRANQTVSYNQGICKGSGCIGRGEIDINANTMVALESGNKSGIQNSGRSRCEAALMKFRTKRKDRCFEKKIFHLITLLVIIKQLSNDFFI